MNKKIVKVLHIATWSVAVLILIIPWFAGKPPVERFTGNVIATFFWMGVYYLFFNTIAPGLLLKKKLVMFFVVSVIILAIIPFIGYTLLFFSRALFEGSFAEFYKGYSGSMHLSGFKAMALAGVYGSFFRMIAEY
jgi:hypothetical protein